MTSGVYRHSPQTLRALSVTCAFDDSTFGPILPAQSQATFRFANISLSLQRTRSTPAVSESDFPLGFPCPQQSLQPEISPHQHHDLLVSSMPTGSFQLARLFTTTTSPSGSEWHIKFGSFSSLLPMHSMQRRHQRHHSHLLHAHSLTPSSHRNDCHPHSRTQTPLNCSTKLFETFRALVIGKAYVSGHSPRSGMTNTFF